MYHKNISYRRQQRKYHIKRKKGIATHVMYYRPQFLADSVNIGKLHKGKVHCSCSLCACKSKKRWGQRNRSIKNWSISDQRKLNSCLEQLKEAV